MRTLTNAAGLGLAAAALTILPASSAHATSCGGPGNVVAHQTSCKKARAAARAYPRHCAHQQFCTVLNYWTCRHVGGRRVECVGGTSSDRIRPVVRFTTAHRVP